MPVVYGFLAGIGFCGALAALWWSARTVSALRRQVRELASKASQAESYLLDLKQAALDERERRISQLEARVAELLPATRADRLQLVHRDLGEADLFGFVKLRDELLDAAKMAEHYAQRAEFVARGGRPDEFPRKGEQA